MNTELLKRYTRRAILALLGALIITIGGLSHDEQTQRRNAEEALRNDGDVQTREALPGPTGSIGPGTRERAIKEVLAGFGKGMRILDVGKPAPYKGGLQEYGINAGQQTTHSFALLRAGDSIRPYVVSGSNDDNLYDTVGVKFKTTAYTAGYESTGKRPGHPLYGITASGKKVKENHTIAADPDVLPIGTVVTIEGLPGTYVVEDTGSAVNGKHIDIYMKYLDDAKDYGVQYRRIIIVKKGGDVD